MKNFLWLVSAGWGAGLLAGVAAGQPAPSATAASSAHASRAADAVKLSPSAMQSADKDFAAFVDLQKTPPPTTPELMGPTNYLRWYQQQLYQINLAGMILYQSYPHDPRRWEVVAALLNNPPMFAKQIPENLGAPGAPSVTVDEQAKAAWTARAAQLRHALMTAPDAKPEARELVDWGGFVREFKIAQQGVAAGRKVNWPAFTAQLDKHVAKYAGLNMGIQRAEDYVGALKKFEPLEARAEWEHLEESPDRKLATYAKHKVKIDASLQQPFALNFKALDGSRVDLAKLQGKVVIIDYWAPDLDVSVTDLPNLQGLYRVYHGKGLEIVGVPLADESDRALVTDFIQARRVGWPQDFDGLGAKTPAADDYGVDRAPNRFVLDQTGKIVATNPTLRDLNALVKKLLGL